MGLGEVWNHLFSSQMSVWRHISSRGDFCHLRQATECLVPRVGTWKTLQRGTHLCRWGLHCTGGKVDSGGGLSFVGSFSSLCCFLCWVDTTFNVTILALWGDLSNLGGFCLILFWDPLGSDQGSSWLFTWLLFLIELWTHIGCWGLNPQISLVQSKHFTCCTLSVALEIFFDDKIMRCGPGEIAVGA